VNIEFNTESFMCSITFKVQFNKLQTMQVMLEKMVQIN